MRAFFGPGLALELGIHPGEEGGPTSWGRASAAIEDVVELSLVLALSLWFAWKPGGVEGCHWDAFTLQTMALEEFGKRE